MILYVGVGRCRHSFIPTHACFTPRTEIDLTHDPHSHHPWDPIRSIYLSRVCDLFSVDGTFHRAVTSANNCSTAFLVAFSFGRGHHQFGVL